MRWACLVVVVLVALASATATNLGLDQSVALELTPDAHTPLVLQLQPERASVVTIELCAGSAVALALPSGVGLQLGVESTADGSQWNVLLPSLAVAAFAGWSNATVEIGLTAGMTALVEVRVALATDDAESLPPPPPPPPLPGDAATGLALELLDWSPTALAFWLASDLGPLASTPTALVAPAVDSRGRMTVLATPCGRAHASAQSGSANTTAGLELTASRFASPVGPGPTNGSAWRVDGLVASAAARVLGVHARGNASWLAVPVPLSRDGSGDDVCVGPGVAASGLASRATLPWPLGVCDEARSEPALRAGVTGLLETLTVGSELGPFETALAQLDCDSWYSLWQCTDCRQAYVRWLCAQHLEPCDPASGLALAPCSQLCHALVQRCPAYFAFACSAASTDGAHCIADTSQPE